MSQNKDIAAKPTRPPAKKLHYVDNCRSCLTALVILHHTACSYGGIGRNIYQSSFHGQASSTALVGLNGFNQSFFMGTYMYLGGYFSRRALERKSRENFIKDRLYRLGLPTLAYTAIGAPLCASMVRAWQGQTVDIRWLIDYWREQRGIRGPVWFTATLLCFDLALVAFDRIQSVLYTDSSDGPAPPKDGRKGINPLKLYASIALCSVSDFFVRTVYPVGRVLNPLKLQPAYLSQYIAAYSLGASVSDFESAIPSLATFSGLLLTSLTSGYILFQGLKDGSVATAQMAGGRNTLAVAYAVWNNANGYLVGSAVLAAFEKYSTQPWTAVNKMAFPAFLVHMPVITLLGIATDKWHLEPVSKTIVVGGLGVVGSWIVGDVVDRLWVFVKGLAVQKSEKKF